jgi:hypothetical protein
LLADKPLLSEGSRFWINPDSAAKSFEVAAAQLLLGFDKLCEPADRVLSGRLAKTEVVVNERLYRFHVVEGFVTCRFADGERPLRAVLATIRQ